VVEGLGSRDQGKTPAPTVPVFGRLNSN
jgi:hypothetical protein